MKMNKKGFTLIEMLVVIAIIAVLVSIIIPVVGNSTTKAQAAANAANLRSIKAEVITKVLTENYTPNTADFSDVKLEHITGFDDSSKALAFALAKDASGAEIPNDWIVTFGGKTIQDWADKAAS